ncbi:MAG: hypothetical protein KGI71_05055 [Patescibacteria group bacterium]|nr:hypothetical protein [Patescibacteria group bacterium]
MPAQPIFVEGSPRHLGALDLSSIVGLNPFTAISNVLSSGTTAAGSTFSAAAASIAAEDEAKAHSRQMTIILGIGAVLVGAGFLVWFLNRK